MTVYDATQGKPVGTLVFGKHLVRQLSERQASFIEKLMGERIYDSALIPVEVDGSINIKQASRIIEYLLSCPKNPALIRPASEKQITYIKSLIKKREDSLNRVATIDFNSLTADDASELINYFQNQSEKRVSIDVGAYMIQGVRYSVRKTENGYLYGVYWLEDEKRFSERDYKIVWDMTPDMKLSFEEAQLFGIQTGVCIYCHKNLTDVKSVAMGMGLYCFKKHFKGGNA